MLVAKFAPSSGCPLASRPVAKSYHVCAKGQGKLPPNRHGGQVRRFLAF